VNKVLFGKVSVLLLSYTVYFKGKEVFMSVSMGLKAALAIIRRLGVKKGMKEAAIKGISPKDISDARMMAFGDSKKFLSKTHPRNKSGVQRKIDARNRAEALARRRKEGF
jgi:hypothetical protein